MQIRIAIPSDGKLAGNDINDIHDVKRYSDKEV